MINDFYKYKRFFFTWYSILEKVPQLGRTNISINCNNNNQTQIRKNSEKKYEIFKFFLNLIFYKTKISLTNAK